MKSAESIEAYIKLYPDKTQKILKKIHSIIKKVIPNAEEAMRYGIPTYRLDENLVHVAAYKNHIGFYPTPNVLEAFSKEIKNYKSSKGAVQFPIAEPIPYDLIAAMTQFRIDQHIKTKSIVKPNKK